MPELDEPTLQVLLTQVDPYEYLVGLFIEPDSLSRPSLPFNANLSMHGREFEHHPVAPTGYYSQQHQRAGSGSLDRRLRTNSHFQQTDFKPSGAAFEADTPSDYLGHVPPGGPSDYNSRDPFKSREPLKLRLKLPERLGVNDPFHAHSERLHRRLDDIDEIQR